MDYDATPRVLDYGLFNLLNFENKQDINVTYFIMPLYEMDLEEYLSKFEGMQKIMRIIDVTSKLVNIFKYVHCSKRTFNDMKLKNIMINTNGNLDKDP